MDAPAEAVAERLRVRVGANAPDLLPWLPLLGIVLGVDLPATRESSELEEQFRKARLEEVALSLLRQVLPTPTVLVVEDAHLIDEASLDLLLHVATARDEEPWLLVVTARDDDPRFVPVDGHPDEVLRLGPLSREESHALLVDETEDHPLPPSTLAAARRAVGRQPAVLARAAHRRSVARRCRDTSRTRSTTW